jgi:hypothetical protein
MRNLTRIAFALLVGCGTSSNNPCEVNPSLPQCQPPQPECISDLECTHLDTPDGCIQGTCDNGTCAEIDVCGIQGSASLSVFVNDDGSSFVGAEFDKTQGFDDFLDAEQEELASIPVGGCVEIPQRTGGADPVNESMGTLQLARAGTTLVEIEPDAQSSIYEEIVATGTINPGDTIDLVITGSPALPPNTFPGFLQFPPAAPTVTGTFDANNRLGLETTLTFEPIAVDHLLFRFNFLEGQTVVTLMCAGDPQSGALPFDSATFDRLPASGSMSVQAFNRTFRVLETDDIERTIRGTVQAGSSVSYQKL